jgi:hypothetical protein
MDEKPVEIHIEEMDVPKKEVSKTKIVKRASMARTNSVCYNINNDVRF